MKRSEFKKILKECLLEILTEEPIIKQKLQESVTHNKKSSGNINAKQIARQIAGADEFDLQNESMLMEQINSMALGASGGDKKQSELFKSIFADTALNTLPQQHEIVPGSGMTNADMNTPGVDIGELAFGGDVSRWANVAFAAKK